MQYAQKSILSDVFFSNTSLPPYNKLDEATESMAVVDTD